MEILTWSFQITVVSANSLGKVVDPNIREIVPPNELEKALSQMSESQLKGSANPFDTLKLLENVFEVRGQNGLSVLLKLTT